MSRPGSKCRDSGELGGTAARQDAGGTEAGGENVYTQLIKEGKQDGSERGGAEQRAR